MSNDVLNLLPPGRRAELRLRRRVTTWTLAAAGYGMVTLGACITLAAGEPVVDRIEAKELTVLARETEAFIAENQVHMDLLKAANLKVQATKLVADHPDWSILLELLAEQRGDEVVIENVDVTPVITKDAPREDEGRKKNKQAKGTATDKGTARPDAFEVKVLGFARSQTAVTDFADRLQKCEVFESVTMTRSSARQVKDGSVIEFNFSCRIGSTVKAPAQGGKQ